MFDLIAPFIVGFVGSLHCLGMCGPLVLAYSLNLKAPGNPSKTLDPSIWQRGVLHHLVFHAGRLTTYSLLGALAGGVAHFARTDLFFFNLPGIVTLLGGTLMVLVGMVLIKVLPLPLALTARSLGTGSLFGRRLPRLFQSKRIGSRLTLGLACGFLPCMLSWAMIIKAATTQTTAAGFLTMAFFGLGTVPVLFLIGLSTCILSMKVRFMGERVAALSVIFIGLILIFKGVRAFG